MEILCPGLRLENVFPDLGLEITPHAEISKLMQAQAPILIQTCYLARSRVHLN